MSGLARGLRDNGRWPEAEALFREAYDCQESATTPTARGYILHELACGFATIDAGAKREPLFRQALRLAETGGDTATSRGITADDLLAA